MTTSESDSAYDHRSRLSHGDAFLHDIPQAEISLYDKLEETLRLAILKAFREPRFAAIFLEDLQIKARWPAQKLTDNNAEVRRIDFERIECPSCGERFAPLSRRCGLPGGIIGSRPNRK